VRISDLLSEIQKFPTRGDKTGYKSKVKKYKPWKGDIGGDLGKVGCDTKSDVTCELFQGISYIEGVPSWFPVI
jgi:hypothetical protein